MLAVSIEGYANEGESGYIVTGPFEPTLEQIQRAKDDEHYRLVDASGFDPGLLAANLPSHAMTVWEFDKAPGALQEIFNQGGDEDLLIYIPVYLLDKDPNGHKYPPWKLLHLVEHSDTCRNPSKYTLPDGAQIYVGTH